MRYTTYMWLGAEWRMDVRSYHGDHRDGVENRRVDREEDQGLAGGEVGQRVLEEEASLRDQDDAEHDLVLGGGIGDGIPAEARPDDEEHDGRAEADARHEDGHVLEVLQVCKK